MSLADFNNFKFILASKSPRRRQLLSAMGLEFEVRTKDVPEDFDPELMREEIPMYLAGLKARAFAHELKNNEVLITSDTVVWSNDKAYNKPADQAEAFSMLRELSGSSHEVITAVCLLYNSRERTFYDVTEVSFSELSDEEIEWYVKEYKPFDKAGSYGIQEWLGYIGVDSIRGSFYNVVGLPTRRLYIELREFLEI